MYPKVLIISHNIYEKTNNIGKTLISLFDGWPKEKLCQIYLRNEAPSFKYCDSYFRITDREIVKSYLKGKKVVGTSFDKNCNIDNFTENSSSNDQKMYNLGNKRIPIISFIRDFVWRKASWNNEKLENWLLSNKPEVILFVPNDYKLIYPIAEYASKFLNIPIVPYYMDDAFYYGAFVSPIDYIRRVAIRKKATNIIKKANTILTIGPKMSKKYREIFKKPCIELMNSVEPNNDIGQPFVVKDKFILGYMGNLHSNRWKSILRIGSQIDKAGLMIEIDIYSASFLTKKAYKKISMIKSIKLCGSVKPDKVNDKLKSFDGLLFVESFNKRSKASTMYSLSTKIPEYLNSFKPIFAYGPKEISSIEYLANNSLATVCTKEQSIVQCLGDFLSNAQSFDRKLIFDFINKYHDINKNREIMLNCLNESVVKGK